MSDIVERLHTRAAECERTTAHDNKDHYLHVVAKLTREDGSRMKEAANEIEKLRAALRPFAEATSKYDPDEGDDDLPVWDWSPTTGMLRKARAALEVK